MKKIFLLFIITFLLTGCNLLKNQQPAALKINANPQATVFIDGKHIGTTPYNSEDLEAGEITLKLVPVSASTQAVPLEGLIELAPGVVTVVNHEFATETSSASGETLTLKPNNRSVASLSVVSQPDAAVVRLDGESKNFTPLVIEQLEAGDHQLLISSPGYQDRTINIRAQNGYRLTVSVQLTKQQTPPVIELDEEESATDKESTESANPTIATTITPKPTEKATKATPTSIAKTPEKPYVKINDTPTGWLRVRSEPTLAGEEVTKVNPGETYTLLEEQSGWYKIAVDNNQSGWIARQYAEKFE